MRGWRLGALAMGVLGLTVATGCRRSAPPAVVRAPQVPAEVPPVIVGETAKAAVLTAPKQFEDLGVKVELPSTWAEGIAPSSAGPGAKLLHRADADLPTIIFVGVPARNYEALKKRSLQAGKEPFEDVSARMRDQVIGPPAGQVGNEPKGRLVSEKAWSAASLARGKVLRYEATDPQPAGSGAAAEAKKSYVDIYIGEARGGSLYVFNAVANDEEGLDEAKAIVESISLTGVKDAGLESPLPPVGSARGR